jgi:hypothetical protein
VPARALRAQAQTGIEHPATGSAGVDALDRTRFAPVVPPDHLPGVASIMPQTSFAMVQSNVANTTNRVNDTNAHSRGQVHLAERMATQQGSPIPATQQAAALAAAFAAAYEHARLARSDLARSDLVSHGIPSVLVFNFLPSDTSSRAAVPVAPNIGNPAALEPSTSTLAVAPQPEQRILYLDEMPGTPRPHIRRHQGRAFEVLRDFAMDPQIECLDADTVSLSLACSDLC